MRRLEQAQDHGLVVWTANPAEFKKKRDEIIHEAEILAVLAEVIQQPGFEYADDETYREYARQLRQQARAVVEAANSGNADQARQATGAIKKSCDNCHEGYRSAG
jgi:hypothetical protein